MDLSRSRKGAWIEIKSNWFWFNFDECRSRKGAWIEIWRGTYSGNTYDTVAPVRERGLKSTYARQEGTGFRRSRKGAWIEIQLNFATYEKQNVAPVRERGLKSCR